MIVAIAPVDKSAAQIKEAIPVLLFLSIISLSAFCYQRTFQKFRHGVFDAQCSLQNGLSGFDQRHIDIMALRQFDETDPVKYDFALFGLGVLEGKQL